MKEIEQMIELENIARHHQYQLDRLIAYSAHDFLNPYKFVIELFRIQQQEFIRCLQFVPDCYKNELMNYIRKFNL